MTVSAISWVLVIFYLRSGVAMQDGFTKESCQTAATKIMNEKANTYAFCVNQSRHDK